MEITLAIVVVAAVVFFGALISAGNERQRKAIDDLREQTLLWAMQDLQIKREKLAREVQIDNPIDWLNRISAKICGQDLNLQVVEAFEEPRALLCAAGNSSGKAVFSPLSPNEIRHLANNKHNRLYRNANPNPLLSLPRGVVSYELSVLNSGILFDLELPLAWKDLTGQRVEQMERLWMYVMS